MRGNQRHRTVERRVPPQDQNPDRASLCGNRANAALGALGIRPDHQAQGRRMANPRPTDRAHVPWPRPVIKRKPLEERRWEFAPPSRRHLQVWCVAGRWWVDPRTKTGELGCKAAGQSGSCGTSQIFDRTSMLRLSPTDQILFGLINATLLFTLAYSVLGFHDQYEFGFGVEDGPIEYGTAICLFMSCLILAWQAAKTACQGRFGGAAWLVLYSAAFLFGAGEEISWGQRIIGWETTGYFAKHNVQNETTLHNLAFGNEQLAKSLFGRYLTIAILLYLVVLPFLYPRVKIIATLTDTVMLPLPSLRHGVTAVAASLVIAIFATVPRKWEAYEFIFSLITISIFMAPANLHQFQRSE